MSKEASLLFIPIAFILNRPLNNRSLTGILKTFSLAMCAYGVFLVIRALLRYMAEGDPSVFFYNELATESISVYLSSFFSLALFFFLGRENKTFWGYIATLFMLCMVMLLSKKSIIITDIFIITLYYLFFSVESRIRKTLLISGFTLAGAVFIIFGNFSVQYVKLEPGKVNTSHTVTPDEAWNQETFTPGDNFSGLSFRVYRTRVLKEMSQEKGFMLTGSGLGTSGEKVTQLAHKHNTLHDGWENVPYNKLNFHNQYMEIYADMGILGLVIILLLVGYNLLSAVKSKYFIHIAFAVLMISLFLTESFLWRQKGVVFFTLFYCLFNGFKPSGEFKKTK